jgi:hypothetical protein
MRSVYSTASFLNQLKGVSNATGPVQSAQVLRQLVKSKELVFADMRDAPEIFSLAHRLLATIGLNGFGVRFAVQCNLFAGSIIGLAGPEQLKMSESIQEKGQLGCFLLTEIRGFLKSLRGWRKSRGKAEGGAGAGGHGLTPIDPKTPLGGGWGGAANTT